MYLGIDLGTSSVKAVLVDAQERVVAHASAPLEVSRPRPLWSEQSPSDWWSALCAAIARLRSSSARELGAVRGIGLSGQMHGATLLAADDTVLRPAILWNDGRSGPQCAELERRAPRWREITGNLVMPGFTAPKLLWVAENEPGVFRRVARILLPKDWLRLRLIGEAVSEMSDASGTLWLDVARRAWSEEMLAATGLTLAHMPRLVEGSQPSGTLRAEVASEWGVPPGAVVAGGAGDNAAGAIGIGVVRRGDAFLSLGTSGVEFVADDCFRPNPAGGVHAFCHCLPGSWHQMSVLLSAASCLSWLRHVTGASTEEELLADAQHARGSAAMGDDPRVLFLPYLSGERTPHNDPHAKGVFFGLTHATTRTDLARAVLEGVAFAFADGQDALLAAGAEIRDLIAIGGGARSALWCAILASMLGRPVHLLADGELGPAFGAARLARLAADGEPLDQVCMRPRVERTIEPDPAATERYARRRPLFRALYADLKERFRDLT